MLKHQIGVCTLSLSFEYKLESLRLRIYYDYVYITKEFSTSFIISSGLQGRLYYLHQSA